MPRRPDADEGTSRHPRPDRTAHQRQMVNDVLIAVTAARAGLLVIPESWSTRRCAGCRLIPLDAGPDHHASAAWRTDETDYSLYNYGGVKFGWDEAKRDWVLAERGIDFLRFQLIRRASRSHGADAARQGRTLSEYWFD